MRFSFGRAGTLGALVLALGAQASSAASIPPAAGVDLHESYTLLTSTYYSAVDPQIVLDGARTALEKELKSRGLKLALAPLHAGADASANIAQIDAAINSAAVQSKLSATDLTYKAIAGMAGSLGDKYTAFFTPAEFKQFNQALDPDKISGIGVLIQPENTSKYIQAFYVVPGTPADKAGLKTGDVFTAIDGTSTQGLTVDKASALLRGKPGTQVSLQVQRDGAALPSPVAIIRSQVQPPTVIFKMLPNKIGYIYVAVFGLNTYDQFNVALARLQDGGARAYVMDLRNDGGGYVNAALGISSKFIATDPIVSIESRGSKVETITADNEAIAPKPMTILVNGYTASASEITAGALQDDGLATLVGTRTFGKGVMQTLTPLPGGAAIKITTQHYLTPKHRDINHKGLDPDLKIEPTKGDRFGEIEHDAQLQAAVSILEKKIAQQI
ncbi:MAG: S41 family peptidase [Candidatus Eremiobacteraeota bacterium]|nr:S41 family peptidase [Candidatus Eremiobacteraeota bacterium]